MSSATTIRELDRRFGIPGIASVVEGNGGLAMVRIGTARAAGEMYLHGAHVTSWKPQGAEEVLFISAQSHWQDCRAIRGGIPICFPWFAARADDATAPMHGLVRTKAWQLESIVQHQDAVTVSMFTASDDVTRKSWSGDFRMTYRVTFGSELVLELGIVNTGSSLLRFEEALHTYFGVGHIDKVRVLGLNGVDYLDKTDSYQRKKQAGSIVISAETDRIYLNTQQQIDVEDHALRRRISVAKNGSLSTVVWNPWIGKAKAMADFGDDEWPGMICVETCNVGDCAVELSPGQAHSMGTTVRVADL